MKEEKSLEKYLLEKIVEKLDEKYLTEENIYVYVLSKNNIVLDSLDSLLNIINISIRFGYYRRAVRYIIIFKFLCKKYFNSVKLEEERNHIKI